MSNDKTLYLECLSGVSGDMMVAALLDLGADQEKLTHLLSSLNVNGYEIEIGRAIKNGIDACDFNVVLHSEHGDSHHYHQRHKHSHGPDHGHSHDHGHDHDHSHSQEHLHRNLQDIEKIFQKSSLTDRAKKTAMRIFNIVAQAEAKAHGLPINDVHFHEVGAVDSIVDIAATAICLDDLGITKVAISKLHEGTGHTRCQHGVLPIPVPAVTNIAAQYALPIVITENKGEMITPTGAAIVAAIKTMASPPPGFAIKAVGLGAGKKDFERANILRAMIIDDVSDSDQERIWVLESNIDDSTGEALAYTVESLFNHGARDAFFTPVFMKKNRPANLLTVICDRETMPALEAIIFTHTTTIGIRKYPVERTFLPREEISVETECGTGLVKRVKYGEQVYCYPEFESVKALCDKTGVGFQEIYFQLMSEAKKVS